MDSFELQRTGTMFLVGTFCVTPHLGTHFLTTPMTWRHRKCGKTQMIIKSPRLRRPQVWRSTPSGSTCTSKTNLLLFHEVDLMNNKQAGTKMKRHFLILHGILHHSNVLVQKRLDYRTHHTRTQSSNSCPLKVLATETGKTLGRKTFRTRPNSPKNLQQAQEFNLFLKQ